MEETIAKPSGSIRTDVVYSLGNLGSSAIGFVISSWLLYFYLPPDGSPLVPVALYGVAILLARIVSAITTPVVGYLSDNSQNRKGRRLPFMFRAAFPLVIYFYLLWVPPRAYISLWNLAFLMIISIAYRVTLAFYQVPYRALLPEIALTERNRVRLSAFQSGFLLIGMLIGGMAGFLIEKQGFARTALIYGVGALIFLYLPYLFLQERQDRKIGDSQRISFQNSLLMTLRNPAFLSFAIVWAAYLVTTSFVQSSAPFIVTEICLLNKADTVYFYVPGLIASLLWYPLVTWFAKRWGKWNVYASSLLLSAIVFPGTMLIGDWLPISMKIQCTTWAVLQSVVISGVIVLSSAFVAEITDYDFQLTGQHREGMYFAAISVIEQLFNGLASMLLPILFLLGRSQNSPRGPLGIRLTGVVGGLLMLIAFIVFLRFPLRHEDVEENHGLSISG